MYKQPHGRASASKQHLVALAVESSSSICTRDTHYVLQLTQLMASLPLLNSVQPVSFHATKCPEKLMGLLPAILMDFLAMMCYDYCNEKSFK